ncbi:MAG TPA: fumarylacetoacetate hydrolase family protein [Ktedonobacteraceae bacterium]|nr:fumarylacetoacetate hydrolase family protein [Ktedonobacteraceae bacterium]
MKLVTFKTSDSLMHAGVIRDKQVVALPYPTLLELLRDPDAINQVRTYMGNEVHDIPPRSTPADAIIDSNTAGPYNTGNELPLLYAFPDLSGDDVGTRFIASVLAPIPELPTLRDFYAFEQHVKTGRAKRGLEMLPEWYEIPTFYFSNTSEIFGPDATIPYPLGCQELDFELEIACVIGREGKNIALEEASDYIAGYTIMNDWSARDFQRKDMRLGLGPGKGKDFATSFGPCLVTPDELTSRRSGSGASERYDMPMLARINGQEVSRGNFKDIYYSFPQMIARASRNARLRVGDVLGSGTVGTGCLFELGTTVHRWLQPHDVVELEIDGIGILRNRIV